MILAMEEFVWISQIRESINRAINVENKNKKKISEKIALGLSAFSISSLNDFTHDFSSLTDLDFDCRLDFLDFSYSTSDNSVS